MGRRSKNKGTKKPVPGPPPRRTKNERQLEVRKIIDKLTELGLTTSHEEILQLMAIMQTYINEGEEITVDIPMPTIGRRIVGVLTAYVNETVWLKLKIVD